MPQGNALCSVQSGPSQGLIRGGRLVVLGGDNVPPLVEIGLTDLPKTGGAKAPPAPPLATALSCNIYMCTLISLITVEVGINV